MLLQNKTAAISGAASARGIGLATAKLFAAHGARIAILDIDEAAAKQAAAELGPQHIGLGCDVANKAVLPGRSQDRASPLTARPTS
jgi:NAD(P)-dependent dehydrogenase (short-subunit alcohol dehydrogenase family)